MEEKAVFWPAFDDHYTQLSPSPHTLYRRYMSDLMLADAMVIAMSVALVCVCT